MVKTIKIKTPQERKIEELEKDNFKLKYQLDTLTDQNDFLESTIVELILALME